MQQISNRMKTDRQAGTGRHLQTDMDRYEVGRPNSDGGRSSRDLRRDFRIRYRQQLEVIRTGTIVRDRQTVANCQGQVAGRTRSS